MVLIESMLDLLYPLFIGWAINGLLDDNHQGLYMLLVLGFSSVIIGSARRFIDTRIYAGIYEKVTPEMVVRERSRNTEVSKISARTNLLNEFVEFLENAMPEVIKALVGLIGVLIIIGSLNIEVFIACLGLLSIIVLIYLFTGRLNYRFNAGFNEELEHQVRVITYSKDEEMAKHFRQLMRWNIKLSDLETGNYFIIWLAVVGLFVFTPLSAVDSDVVNYGLVFALLMYVFEYIEKVITLPLFVQQLIRLKEISVRMA
ncbi:MAG: ABC transporter six-transmembrane domain-containing protein [Thiotrichales bacterium]|nr:ABC transporter six-transmembrane domain-containing protein [Thiotrichales bacterium]